MAGLAEDLVGKSIPLIGWTVVDSARPPAHLPSSGSWEGWNDEWEVLALDDTADPIVRHEGEEVAFVPHGTGTPPDPDPIGVTVDELNVFLRRLVELGSPPGDDLKRLRTYKKELVALRKTGPKHFVGCLKNAASDLTERIADLRHAASPQGKYQAACRAFAEQCYAELRQGDRYQNLLIGGHSGRKVLVLTGRLADGESKEEVFKVVERLGPPYPPEDQLKGS